MVKTLFCLCLIFSTNQSFAALHSVETNYWTMEKEFYKFLCPPKTIETFQNLFQNYNQHNYFVPMIENLVDWETISTGIPLIEEKLLWNKQMQALLVGMKDFTSQQKIIKEIKLQLQQLVKIQEDIEWPKSNSLESSAIIQLRFQAWNLYQQIMLKFFTLIDQIKFLTHLHFPIDYLELRREFDWYQDQQKIKDKNRVFFKRRIYEEGFGNDATMRGLLSMVYLKMTFEGPLLSYDFRLDLTDALNFVDHALSIGSPSYYIQNLEQWGNLDNQKLAYYKKLLESKEQSTQLDDLVKYQNARYLLSEFNSNKQKQVVDFWKGKPKIYKKIYVGETILTNEVGPYDGPGALERKEVLDVVLNRTKLKSYRIINDAWLGTLFKPGEFSFTYSFIPGSLQVYCPSRAPSVMKLRKENVDIVIEKLLSKTPAESKAIRYYSRKSMFARLDMGKLWPKLSQMPQKLGVKIEKNTQFYLDAIHNGHYNYLYSFESPGGPIHRVLEIMDSKKIIIIQGPVEDKNFYHYRDPQYFRYFIQL